MSGITRDRSPWVLILALMIVLLMFQTEGILVYAAIPSFYREFDNPQMIGWVLSGYYLVAGLSTALGGVLGDLFGRRRLLLWLMLLTLLGGLIAATATNLLQVVIGHSLQGVGVGMI